MRLDEWINEGNLMRKTDEWVWYKSGMLAVLLILILVTMAVTAEVNKTALPGRAPMHSHLLKPSAEWTAYYDVAPEDQRVLFWTVKTLLEATRQQQVSISDLCKRLAKLEPKSVDPNQPQSKEN
jgi:hypothetical protein